MMQDVVIVSAVRTAIGKLGGTLSSISVSDLGATVIKEAMHRANLSPSDPEEVIMGQVIQAGTGPNPARQALLKAGLPKTTPGYTVNKVCASGMKAVALGALEIAAGNRNIVIAGGMENMSAAPHLLLSARKGYSLGDGVLSDAILCDALQDPLINCHMGNTAETLATEFGITREEQDHFAAQSQQKTGVAITSGWFTKEIAPVAIPQRKGNPILFSTDEFPRPDTTVEKLSALRPAFKPDGTVTAGNASGINDGAAALVLMSAQAAKERGIHPLCKIIATVSTALEPERMGLGPVSATKAALQKAGYTLNQIDTIELNEAFAAQSLAVIRQLGADPNRVNPAGGAIALGHPVGASGARILVTLLHTMMRNNQHLGLATLCVGGGQGMAVIVTREV
jgi:acetyl-CoA C-acetyltransferase